MSITALLEKSNLNNQNLDQSIEEKNLSQWLTQNNLPAMNIDMNEYLKLLAFTKTAAKNEQNTQGQKEQENIAINNAYKLAVIFGDFSSALTYLKRYETQNNTEKQMVHDACLFSLPKDDRWNLKLWRTLIEKNSPGQPSDLIMRLLPFSAKIEVYVAQHQAELEAKLKDDVLNDYKIKFSDAYDEMLKQQNAVVNINNVQKADYVKQMLEKHRKEIYKVFLSKKPNILSANTDLKSIFNYAKQAFYDRAAENIEAAELFFQYGLTETDFNHYLSLAPKDDDVEIPDVLVLGSDIAEEYKKYYIKKLKSTDPRAAILGKLTSCCQSLGDIGESSVLQGITRSDNGFYVICEMKGTEPNDNDKVVSQCWAWRSRKQAIVFDSIESHIDFKKKHETLIIDLYTQLSYKLIEKGVPSVLVGADGGTPSQIGVLTPITFEMLKPSEITYTDSVIQRIIADKRFLDCLHDIFVQSNGQTRLKKPEVEPFQYTQKERLAWIDLYIHNQTRVSNTDSFKISEADIKNRTSLIVLWMQLIADTSEKHPYTDEQLLLRIKDLIKNEIDVNLKNDKGLSLLGNVVKRNKPILAEFLLKHGADVNTTNELYQNCLYVACKTASWDETLVKLLLQYGADPLMDDREKAESPLYLCCRYGLLRLLDILASNISIDTLKNLEGDTLMHIACQHGYVDIIKYLHAKGLTFDTLNKQMKTPLDCAMQKESLAILNYVQSLGISLKNHDAITKVAIERSLYNNNIKECLLLTRLQDFGVDLSLPNSNGDYPVLLACEFDAKLALQYFVEAGCSLTVVNKEGRGPLHVACSRGHWSAAHHLLNLGMDVNSRAPQNETSLHLSCSLPDKVGGRVTQLLLNNRADPDVLDHCNQTPLHYACKAASIGHVFSLSRARANFNVRDKDGKTPIFYALYQVMSDEQIKELRDTGKISYDDSYKASNKAIEIIFYLIKNGASLDIKDNNNLTILELVKQTGNKEIIDFVEARYASYGGGLGKFANKNTTTLFQSSGPNLTPPPVPPTPPTFRGGNGDGAPNS